MTRYEWGRLAFIALPVLAFGAWLVIGLVTGQFISQDEYTDKVRVITRRDTPVRYWMWCALLVGLIYGFLWLAHTGRPGG